MSFSNRILVGLGAGVLVGLFLGDRAVALKWAADGFVKLLQMTVLPYVTVSIVGSLGRLEYADARRLALRTGGVLVAIWGLTLLFAFAIPLAFPRVENASFFSTTLVEHREPFNFVDLYIPSNPFYSLANNVVPAVVLFSVLVGVALIGVERKELLLDLLTVAGAALSRTTRFVVRLTPYGLFAIAAVAAGTLSVEQLGRLNVFLILYVLVALLVSLWVLPALVSAVTPIRMTDLFRLTRNALLTAFVAGDLFIVLPVLIEASRTLLERMHPPDPEGAALPDVIVPASFNVPHAGKVLSISFILFAGWFADAAIRYADYPRLAVTGLVTFFGSVNVAVPYLLDLFRIPADTFQLFVASGVINSRFGSLLAAMHTLAVALIGACAMTHRLRWERRRLVRYVVTTCILTVAVIGGSRLLFARVMDQTYTKDKVLTRMHLMPGHAPATVFMQRSDPPPVAPGAGVLDTIRARQALRVGFVPDALPYAFTNERGDLVGLDVELASQLARELHVRLELLRIDRERLEAALDDGYCDVVMSGIVVTTERATRLTMSNAYLDETLAIVVPDADRDRFASWDGIRALGAIRLIVPNAPYFIDSVRRLAPGATLVPTNDIGGTFRTFPAGADAMVFAAERGSAWTLMYPSFSVVMPEPGIVKIPLAYPVARHDQAFLGFLNTWIELKRGDGTIDAAYRYWILGQERSAKPPRWSIVRNVLHWVE